MMLNWKDNQKKIYRLLILKLIVFIEENMDNRVN